jgi:nucleotide-binding universal stress UspA family protein
MLMPARRPTIVVGYDGSPTARAAVEYAVREAGTDKRLVIVHSIRAPSKYIATHYSDDVVARMTDLATALMDDLARDPVLAGIDFQTEIVDGLPGPAICRIAEVRGAEAIVVGSRGLGRVRAVLGSVAHDVLHRARCPVLVIPERVVKSGMPHDDAGAFATA